MCLPQWYLRLSIHYLTKLQTRLGCVPACYKYFELIHFRKPLDIYNLAIMCLQNEDKNIFIFAKLI